MNSATPTLGFMRESGVDLDQMLAAMEEGVLLVDGLGTIVFTNPSAATMLGGSSKHLGPGPLRSLAEEAASGRTAVVEVEIGPAGRWLRASGVPMGGSALLVLRDITQDKHLENVRRDFVANASHELKTPAAAIRAAAETVRQAVRDDPDAAERFSEQVEKEAVRMSRIVSDLLDLSRLESGIEIASDVDLEAVVREEAGRFTDLAAQHGIALTVGTSQCVVSGSERDLGLLVRNLTDNAIHYTPTDGEVAVSLARERAFAVLRVRDTGAGIPEDDLARVFERFYRVDRARSRETGGTGLGLSIVKHVAENHGGTVEVVSKLGRGTTFTVRLPSAGPA